MYDYKLESKGLCPICDRQMYDVDGSINKHHFVPKSRGGKATEWCHRVCHNMLHNTWTNKELERDFSDPEKIKTHAAMKEFINWVKKKDPLFYISTKKSNDKNRRK